MKNNLIFVVMLRGVRGKFSGSKLKLEKNP